MAKTQAPITPVAFDVDDFEDVQSSPVAIKHPLTGATTTLVVELAGPEHPARKRVPFERARRMRAGLMRTGKMQLGDPEQDVEDQTDDLARLYLASLYARSRKHMLEPDSDLRIGIRCDHELGSADGKRPVYGGKDLHISLQGRRGRLFVRKPLILVDRLRGVDRGEIVLHAPAGLSAEA